MTALNDWLFGAAWFLPAGVIALGAVVALLGVVRRKRGLLVAAAVLDLVGFGWLAASVLVETPAEFAENRTNAIVAAYDAGDWPEFRRLLDARTTFDGWLVGPEIADAAEATHAALNQESAEIVEAGVARDELGVQNSVEVVSYQAGAVPRLRTAWRFDFREDPSTGDHFLHAIEMLPTDRVEPDDLRKFVVPGTSGASGARRP